MTVPITGAMIVKHAQIFRGKDEVPPGSNTGPFVLQCQHATFLSGTGWPWCAAFVCFVCKGSGVPLAYNGAGAHDLADHHPPAVPQSGWEPGMVVDFNIGSGHTGILVSHTKTTVTTCDGNWGDAVTQHVSDIGLVRKVWKIPGVHYKSGTSQPILPPQQPRWVVTTGKNGHKKLVFHRKRGVISYLGRHVFPNGVTIKRGKNAA